MKINSTSKSGLFTPRVLLAFSLCSVGAFLAFASTTEKWAIETSPNTSVSQQDTDLFAVTGVTCASASQCWAVGYYYDGSVDQTLIEQWDGSSWSIVTSANTSASQDNLLNGVTCASASQCWAVGYYYNGSVYQTLIEQWNGSSWSIVSSPNTSASQFNFLYGVFLNGVTCASTSECWAVGDYSGQDSTGNNFQRTLIEQWNGSSWSIVSSPNATQYNALTGVTCVSGSDCWAVGDDSTGNPATLTEHWNGTSWSVVASPIAGDFNNDLASVTCVSTSDCWAVGSYDNVIGLNGTALKTLIEHWDGSLWSIVTSPNGDTSEDTFGANSLNGVTCTSASQCWAVGYYYNGNALQTLIEQWNGTSWSIVTSPNSSASQFNALSGVTCTSASQCWAVGIYDNLSAFQTLIEEYTTNAVTITASASPSAGGTVSGGSTYVSGTSVTVIATAKSGYVFTSWKQGTSVVSTSPSYTFTATSNRTLVAVFTPTYSISTSASPSAGGTTSGGGTYIKGSSVTVTATPNASYTFTNWTQGSTIVSHSASYTFTASANRTLVANFTTNPVILATSVSPNGGGTTSGDGTYASGASVTVKATPSIGYTFTYWTLNGNIVSHTATYTFKMNSNTALVANFTTNPVTVTTSASPTTGGTTSGGGVYANGDTATVKASAKTGYKFTNWTENGSVVSTTASYSFTATSNTAVVANFTQTFKIVVSASPSTDGTVTGGGTYVSNANVTVTATPKTGHTFTNWTEGGSVVSTTASYSFPATTNRTLVANFL